MNRGVSDGVLSVASAKRFGDDCIVAPAPPAVIVVDEQRQPPTV
jgi:hypothetical protein